MQSGSVKASTYRCSRKAKRRGGNQVGIGTNSGLIDSQSGNSGGLPSQQKIWLWGVIGLRSGTLLGLHRLGGPGITVFGNVAPMLTSVAFYAIGAAGPKMARRQATDTKGVMPGSQPIRGSLKLLISLQLIMP